MYRKILAFVIIATMMLTACSLDEIATPENTVAETTTETTVTGPIREGNYIYFGNYYKYTGKPGPIEWKILKEEDGKLLIISSYILRAQPYNTERIDVTWETCSLRSWLNEDFINEAFSSSDQKYILTVTISNPDNPKYGTEGGNDTEDKVFLLSIDEANTLFADKQERGLMGSWWLRSPGIYSRTATGVGGEGVAASGGYISTEGWYVESEIGVRPAMWIKLDS